MSSAEFGGTYTGTVLRAPFPWEWFGGKSRVASLVWSRFGNVPTYNEPFAGSLAVLLGRPHEPRVETVNDKDAHLANFWRALQHDPDQVAFYADSPVNEADLHARHRWLVSTADERAERVMSDADYYDMKAAGWWVWGQCLWIGSGWCNGGVEWKQPPDLTNGEGIGVARKRFMGVGNGQGAGVHRRWQGGGQAGGGSGVHARGLSRQLPQIPGDGAGTQRGLLSEKVRTEGLYVYMQALAFRLRRVRVCCGDWRRILTPSVTTYIGLTAVFLDPPYKHDLRERCYSEDHDISADVREWAIANGDNPDFRIALCGYEGEHTMPDSWECVPWKAHGGYSRTARGKANRHRERIWFSPHCLKPENQLPFDRELAP